MPKAKKAAAPPPQPEQTEPQEEAPEDEDQDSLLGDFDPSMDALDQAVQEITVTEDMKRTIAAARKRASMVDLEDLIKFIFPPELQHAMSTGRLLAFGFYGPLDRAARLRSGYLGQHVVSRWELDTMCRQFEREDILQVYMQKGQSASSLSEEEGLELLAQADTRMKVAKGKALMKQVTEQEVRQLFSDLPRDEDGLLTFHEMQQRIMQFRENAIERNKIIFPHLTPGVGKPGASTPPGERHSKRLGDAGGRNKGARGKKSSRVSESVAPPEMFLKDKGHSNMEVASYTNKLLSTRAFQLANIADGNSSELTANVRLVRSVAPGKPQPVLWDPYGIKKGTNMGSFVKTAKSSTTSKRKNTIY